MPSIGKDRGMTPSHPVMVMMVHLAVVATSRMVRAAVAATSKMVRAAVVGTGAAMGVVRKAATKMKAKVARSQKRVNTGAEILIRRWL